MANEHFDNQDYRILQTIINNSSVVFHYQPIISSHQKNIIGYEGLMRGKLEQDERLISPLDLYKSAQKYGRLLELDRLCRRKCVSSFEEFIYRHNNNLILFLNYEISLLEEGTTGAIYMVDLAKKFGVLPHNIVIEVIESKVKDTKALQRFIEVLKYYGFLIALDDVGVGHSNFDRIPIVKPNIIKIDRSIIKGIENDYYKQEVFKALVNLCKKIGALVLAEGVETIDEVVFSLNLGADLLQGYFFSKPLSDNFNIINEDLSLKIHNVVDIYKNFSIKKLKINKKNHAIYEEFINRLIMKIRCCSIEEIQEILEEEISKVTFIDALYVLDKRGIQVIDTVVLYNFVNSKNVLFMPAKQGDDLSSKDYYYLLVNTGLKRFITDTYISHATGNKCRTISILFDDCKGTEYILCIDIHEPKELFYQGIMDEYGTFQ